MKGVAASPGIEICKAYILKKQPVVINKTHISDALIQSEISRFYKAVDETKKQLHKVMEKAEKNMGVEEAKVFEAHIMLLEDPELLNNVFYKIQNEMITADNALSQVIDEYVNIFGCIEDEYLRERACDIKDVGERLIRNMLGIFAEPLSRISERVIVVAKDLTPSDTALMNKDMVLAFATDMGGRTSHTAIMARSLEIPAVVGLGSITSKVKDGDIVIVDGNRGCVYVNPDIDVLEKYMSLRQDYIKYCEELKCLKHLPAETIDRLRRVELSANLGTPDDVKAALENGAEGVGLFRSEFLYMNRSQCPGEEEQFKSYKKVAEAMDPRPVIIRTLDIGGDKKLEYLDMPDELNPFLGWRAIRICLDRVDIFKTQLRAILRASYYGKLRIMYPMISSSYEIRKANTILEQAKQELREEGMPFDENIEVGIMIEVPSAAVIADILIKEVDFFSIGTNDLIQYTLAIDRMNENISGLYEPLHPAVLRLVKNVIDASHMAGKWTGMCGEMAGDVEATAILIGLGLDEFSMSSQSIPRIKKLVRSLSYEKAQDIAKQALLMDNQVEIRDLVCCFSENIFYIDNN